MDNHKTSSVFHQLWARSHKRMCEDGEVSIYLNSTLISLLYQQTEYLSALKSCQCCWCSHVFCWASLQHTVSQDKQETPAGLTIESRILDFERAKRTALLQQAERTCDAVAARHSAVLGRGGLPVQCVALSSPRPSALPIRTKRSGVHVSRCPHSDVPPLNVEAIDRNQRSPGGLDEEDDSFWNQVALGSQLAVLSCEEMETSTLSSVDSDMPGELRDLPLIRSPVDCTAFKPPTPPRARRRVSRLPVPSTHREEGKKKCRST